MRISVEDFKQQCLALLDQVARTRVPIVVTKRGKPLARVVPVGAPNETPAGGIRVPAESDEELFSTGEVWDVEVVQP